MSTQMSENIEYVKANIDTLLNIYRNKYILVNNKQVVGSYDSYDVAAQEGVTTYGIEGGFLVYYVTETMPVNFIAVAKF